MIAESRHQEAHDKLQDAKKALSTTLDKGMATAQQDWIDLLRTQTGAKTQSSNVSPLQN